MHAVKRVVRARPLMSFLIINFSISWTFLYPCYRILQNAEEGSFSPWALIGMIGAYGPSIAALVVTGLVGGRPGVKDLLRGIFIRGVSVKLYVAAVLIPLALMTLALLAAAAFDGFSPGRPAWAECFRRAFPYLLIALPFGPMGEELGWRGYLLPRLLDRCSPVRASLLLGLVWTVWHSASFTFPGAAIPAYFPVNALTISLFLGTMIGECYFMTWAFLKSRGSVLIAVLFHAGFNAAENIVFSGFPELGDRIPVRSAVYVAHMILLLLVGLGWLLFGSRRVPAEVRIGPNWGRTSVSAKK